MRSRISSFASSKPSDDSKNRAPKTSMCVVKSPMSDFSDTDSNNNDRGSFYRKDQNRNDGNDEFNDIESYLAHTRASINSRHSGNSLQSDKEHPETLRASMTHNRKHRGLSMNQRMKEKLTMRNLAAHTDATTPAVAGATSTKKPMNTIAPYNTGGSVSNSAHVGTAQKPIFSFKEKLRMMHDVVAGILFLHQEGYMHCDIKSPNFLVANDRTVKVADLGEARELYGSCELHESCEPEDLPNPALNWAPPEMLNPVFEDRSYTMFSDVYGVAMVLSEILLQVVPLDDSKIKLSEKTVYSKLVNENYRPTIPSTIPIGIIEILEKAWCTKPSDRVSCEQLLAAIENEILAV